MVDQYNLHANKHTQSVFANIAISRWFGVRLDISLNIFNFVSIFGAIFLKGFIFVVYSLSLRSRATANIYSL